MPIQITKWDNLKGFIEQLSIEITDIDMSYILESILDKMEELEESEEG